MLDAIATPFGWLMRQFYELTGNFGLAVILFSLAVTIVLLPFMAKSKKGMMRMTRLQPKLMELQKKHEGNQQKLNEEIAKLYRQEKASPMGGCLWTLLPFPILLALYRAVIKPLTIVMGVPDELLAEGFPPATVDAVVALTRKEEETYEDYVGRCSLNPLARRVKLHDLEDNMDLSRLSRVTEKDLERLNRYVRAFSFLKA